VAALLADQTRAAILATLAGGIALPAGELARASGVSAGTASQHLAKLVAAGWLAVERHGRHRYYRIDRPDVLEVFEALAKVAPVRPIGSLRGARASKALRLARSCYDHLAGAAGVAVFDALRDRGGLAMRDGTWRVQRDARVFSDFGVQVPADTGRRPLVRACLDWSERRHHLAGRLGGAVLSRMTEQGWCESAPENRSIIITDAGWSALGTTLGINRARLLATAS
jgi:DNA-binding transcriptional ArsR family regulator